MKVDASLFVAEQAAERGTGHEATGRCDRCGCLMSVPYRLVLVGKQTYVIIDVQKGLVCLPVHKPHFHDSHVDAPPCGGTVTLHFDEPISYQSVVQGKPPRGLEAEYTSDNLTWVDVLSEVKSLPKKYTAMNKFRKRGYTHKGIAESVGCSTSNVTTTLTKGDATVQRASKLFADFFGASPN